MHLFVTTGRQTRNNVGSHDHFAIIYWLKSAFLNYNNLLYGKKRVIN